MSEADDWTIHLEQRPKGGRRAWRAHVTSCYGLIGIGYWYGRTREQAQAKAQRWVDRDRRRSYRETP